jgi:predicted nucleic acid-binding protein
VITVTVDVNVFVSALISKTGNPYRVWVAWRHRRFALVASEHIVQTTLAKLRSSRLATRYHVAADDLTILRRSSAPMPGW